MENIEESKKKLNAIENEIILLEEKIDKILNSEHCKIAIEGSRHGIAIIEKNHNGILEIAINVNEGKEFNCKSSKENQMYNFLMIYKKDIEKLYKQINK